MKRRNSSLWIPLTRLPAGKNHLTKLRMLRNACGYSQKELAEKSGVNLRTLQEYDSRAMDINRATGGTLNALSRVLGCQVEDLLEYDYAELTEE